MPENEENLFSDVVRHDLVELLYRCHSLATSSKDDDSAVLRTKTFIPRKELEKNNYDKLKAKYKNLFAENAPAKQN